MSRHAMTGLICTEEVLRPFLSLAYPPPRARSFRFSRDGRRFVHEQPIELDLPHGLGKLLKVHRLDDVAVDAQLVALHDVAVLPRRGQRSEERRVGKECRSRWSP